MENECLICFEKCESFVVVCEQQSHNRICARCYQAVVDISICPTCRQPNPLVQRVRQLDEFQDESIRAVESEDTFEEEEQDQPYLQVGFGDQMIHVKILRFPFTRVMKQEIDNVLESFILNPRRSERIAQRNTINYAELGRNYRV